MRLVTVDIDGRSEVGVRTPAGILGTGYESMVELIAAGGGGVEAARTADVPLPAGRIAAPIVPGKLLFCGINYRSHLEENPGAVLPEGPFIFSKLPSAVIGPDEEIVLPRDDLDADYEVELAFVIGRRARHVRAADAHGYVFGYTIANDVSARAIQFRDAQITLGKNLDTFAPLGPEIVTPDELGDISSLRLTATVNGELRQSDVAGSMIFSVPRLIEELSALMTLEPGDLVTTGTPAGVAAFRTPPPWLRPGDEVVLEIEGIGRLSNRVVSRPPG
jgi:2-keto-4-pentenoate hydratase/2-oxohepta-3-ene-1,7-dioic acid hydratase in catechol pathway